MRRKSAVIELALAAAASVYAFCRFSTGHLKSIHPMKRPAEGQTRVACVGDSITYGHGVRNWPENAYPAVLGKILGDAYCVNNFGYSGRTASLSGDYPYENEELFQKSMRFEPNIVILMLGTNDSKPYNWKGKTEYAADLRRLIETYRGLPSVSTVMLATPPPAFPGDGGKVAYDINGEIIRNEIRDAVCCAASEEQALFADVFLAFSGKPELFSDGVHPNARGAKVLAETVAGVLNAD